MNKFIIIGLITIISSFTQVIIAQPVTNVEYGISSNISSEKGNINSLFKKARKVFKEMVFDLSFNTDESLFKKRLSLDIGNATFASTFANIMAGGEDTYYKNTTSGEFLQQTEYASQTFLVDIKNQEQNWQLTKESKMIGNYKCYKAILTESYFSSRGVFNKREIIAWYTPEISVQFGPLNYGNLPGLIIELIKGKFTYYVKGINRASDFKIKKPYKGKPISLEDFYKLQSANYQEKYGK